AEMRAVLPVSPAGRAMMRTHWRELIARLDPDILWNDIGYPDAQDLWELLADYYNARPDGLINDRFQLPGESHAALADPAARAAFNRAVADALSTPGFAFAPDLPPVFDHRTPEYAVGAALGDTPWETVRGIGNSFGFNAAETAGDHLDGDALIDLFLRIVGAGGNLLINLGPMADGQVPELQAAPLRALGAFVRTHPHAIFATRPSDLVPRVDMAGASFLPVRSGRRHFALVPGAAAGAVRLPGWAGLAGIRLPDGPACPVSRDGDTLIVQLPQAGVRVLELMSEGGSR
ncbi:MAG: alpha-L-fucosidase, partial [Sphingomonadaceae bacterium]